MGIANIHLLSEEEKLKALGREPEKPSEEKEEEPEIKRGKNNGIG